MKMKRGTRWLLRGFNGCTIYGIRHSMTQGAIQLRLNTETLRGRKNGRDRLKPRLPELTLQRPFLLHTHPSGHQLPLCVGKHALL